MTKQRKTVLVNLPIDIEQGKAGLWYVTSPLVRGLLVAERTEEEALAKVGDLLADLTEAAAS